MDNPQSSILNDQPTSTLNVNLVGTFVLKSNSGVHLNLLNDGSASSAYSKALQSEI